MKRVRLNKKKKVNKAVSKENNNEHLIWDVVEDGTKIFKPHEGQQKILSSDARFLAAIAGTGGGKTALGPLWLMLQIQKYPNAMWMVLAPTYKILERATVPTLIRTFRGTVFEGYYKQGLYVLPDGGQIYCLSTEREEGIEGGQIRAAWLDEAGQMTWRAWVAVQGRLGQLKGRALLTTTPYSINWLKKEFLDRFVKGDKDYFVASWSSVLNPAYPQEEYNRARKTLPLALFQMRYDARFTMLEGQIFREFDADYNVRPCMYDPERAILVGSDFNVNPMAWVLCHRYNDVIEVFDELFIKHTTTTRTLDVLAKRYATHRGGFRFFGDATGAARSTKAALSDYQQIVNHPEFVKLGRTVHYPKANPPKLDRFAATNGALCAADGRRRLYIDPSCENLISDLEGRFYKLGTREPQDSEEMGHMTDALGYIIHRLFPVGAFDRLEEEDSGNIYLVRG